MWPRFEPIDDPVERLERNERSTRLALWFFLGSVIAVGVLALGIGASVDVTGPACPPGGDMCTTGGRVAMVAAPTGLAFALSVFALWETYTRWHDYVRWRPWLLISQFMWIGTTAYLLVSTSVLFVHR